MWGDCFVFFLTQLQSHYLVVVLFAPSIDQRCSASELTPTLHPINTHNSNIATNHELLTYMTNYLCMCTHDIILLYICRGHTHTHIHTHTHTHTHTSIDLLQTLRVCTKSPSINRFPCSRSSCSDFLSATRVFSFTMSCCS